MLCTKIFCSLSGLAVALVVGASTAADAQTTALRGARVIDGTGAAPLDSATIVIRDGRIVAVGESAETPVPSEADRGDLYAACGINMQPTPRTVRIASRVRGMDFNFATEPSLCEGHRYQ